MERGGELKISIDFGRGPMDVHFSLAAAPSPGAAPAVIYRATHLGEEVTDLTEAERCRILEEWRSPS